MSLVTPPRDEPSSLIALFSTGTEPLAFSEVPVVLFLGSGAGDSAAWNNLRLSQFRLSELSATIYLPNPIVCLVNGVCC